MFTSILAAYDGSKGAYAALEKAADLAKLTGAGLTVLTCYRHHSMLEASLSMVRGARDTNHNLDDVMREVSREAAEEAKTHAQEMGVPSVQAFIKNGPSARTIVSFASERKCDLIVIGARGLGSTEGYLLGSVSHKVTSLTDVPVLVV
ncbi:universal stress protein family protein [Roseivivax marinus]|jgi:nucleotide-binding universal stress UspA family protein|uniref:Universal stress protein family protein n=1 Tax=Roseivivax marinus TaxID=1379903 RepID=W4HLC9_9RHOB|nr:universal stress protein [Roseivivax marinus]ETW13233.1 universal stress protein family protein [Roseivivax marinus]UMA63266.1 universal stress protein [Roseivivax marinus]SEK70673.1 Nucleotide-binding universal stress protein, UspA family [Roseivivax marinus]